MFKLYSILKYQILIQFRTFRIQEISRINIQDSNFSRFTLARNQLITPSLKYFQNTCFESSINAVYTYKPWYLSYEVCWKKSVRAFQRTWITNTMRVKAKRAKSLNPVFSVKIQHLQFLVARNVKI